MSAEEAPAAHSPGGPPGTFRAFGDRFPDLMDAHERITRAAESAGVLDAKPCALVRIGLALGAGLESAVRSHVRRACEAGASEEEVEQAIALAATTLGFPRTIAGWSWARRQFERDRASAG